MGKCNFGSSWESKKIEPQTKDLSFSCKCKARRRKNSKTVATWNLQHVPINQNASFQKYFVINWNIARQCTSLPNSKERFIFGWFYSSQLAVSVTKCFFRYEKSPLTIGHLLSIERSNNKATKEATSCFWNCMLWVQT